MHHTMHVRTGRNAPDVEHYKIITIPINSKKNKFTEFDIKK